KRKDRERAREPGRWGRGASPGNEEDCGENGGGDQDRARGENTPSGLCGRGGRRAGHGGDRRRGCIWQVVREVRGRVVAGLPPLLETASDDSSELWRKIFESELRLRLLLQDGVP